VFVCVALRKAEPVVIDRRRVELIEAGLPNQPYEHETQGLDRVRAQALVNEVQESALHCAEREIARLRATCAGEILAIAMREALLPKLPASVAEAHASSHVMVRADPMIYHEALCKAAAAFGISVESVPRGKEIKLAAEVLGITAPAMEGWLGEIRENLGAPWQKDHREAAARAIVGLGKFAGARGAARR